MYTTSPTGPPVANTANLGGGGTDTFTSSVEKSFQNPIYDVEENSKLRAQTETSEERTFINSLYDTSNIQREDDRSQIHHSSKSPPVKTGTTSLHMDNRTEQPVHEEANLPAPTAFAHNKAIHPSKSEAAYEETGNVMMNLLGREMFAGETSPRTPSS